MCPNFCMLYCLENVDLTKCKTCEHARYKLITRKGRTLVANRKLRYFLIIRMDISLFYHCKNMELVIMGNRSQSQKATSP